eukprot:46797-Eustigmatos_ZCMA.PRE.1
MSTAPDHLKGFTLLLYHLCAGGGSLQADPPHRAATSLAVTRVEQACECSERSLPACSTRRRLW